MMKITGNTDLPAIPSSKLLNRSQPPDSDLLQRPNSRKGRKALNIAGGGVRLRRDGAPSGKRSRPETPLLRWKFDEDKVVVRKDVVVEVEGEAGRKVKRGKDVAVSARKLAAGLWRLQLPEGRSDGSASCTVPKNDGFGFQTAINHSGLHSPAHHSRKSYDSQAKDLVQSPHSVSGPRNNKFLYKLEPSFHFSNSAMEGATKWDPGSWRTSDEVKRIYGHSKPIEQQVGVVSMVSVLKSELEHARARIHELETERKTSKKKLEQFLKKLNEERAAWRSREHEKICTIIDDIKGDLNRERKNRRRMEMVNSKLVNELADVKLSAKRYIKDYEKERKARELIEEVCDELAKEIGEDKAEVEALKRESLKLREEVEDEQKMLQVAEVWREERVQMKLVDAKVTLEDKYSQMNTLVAKLETFLKSKGVILDAEEVRRAEILQLAAAKVSIQDMKEYKYERPNPDDIFSVFGDVNFRELANGREVEPAAAVYSPASHASKVHTVSPDTNMFNKDGFQRHYSNAYFDLNSDLVRDDNVDDDDDDDDESGWETVSHLEDHGSSYSPNGSDPSVNNLHRDSNVSGSRMIEWEGNEDTAIAKISEVCPAPAKQTKKISAISRLWRSHLHNNGETCKVISVEGMNGNGRLSNGARLSNSNRSVLSPDRGSARSGLSPSYLVEQWSSPDSGRRNNKECLFSCNNLLANDSNLANTFSVM